MKEAKKLDPRFDPTSSEFKRHAVVREKKELGSRGVPQSWSYFISDVRRNKDLVRHLFSLNIRLLKLLIKIGNETTLDDNTDPAILNIKLLMKVGVLKIEIPISLGLNEFKFSANTRVVSGDELILDFNEIDLVYKRFYNISITISGVIGA